jgi:hypothetical protein
MDPTHWDRIKTLYDEARARPATDRAAFLAGACLDDPILLLPGVRERIVH